MLFQGIEKKSIEGLAERLSALTIEKIEKCYQNRKENYQVWSEVSVTENKIPVINWNNTVWTLNSQYDPGKAASDWALQFEESVKNANSIVIVYGLGDGKSILELQRLKPDCRIIVYEPCQEIFWEVMCYPEVAEVISNKNTCVLVEGICEEYFFHVLQEILDYSNYQLVVQAILPNYDQIFRTEYRKMLDIYKNIVELIVFTRNTEILRGIEIQRNTYALTKDMLEQYSIVQLQGIVQRQKLDDVPAVLVAAGPSLDKNVSELKFAKGKAFIMVADTALNTVLEQGILPDMTISIDSRKPMTLFKNEKFSQIPIVLSLNSNQKVVEKNMAQHYYEIEENGYVETIIKETTNKECQQLPTGGSVANNALSLLIEMGFKTIILVGQDLAYPGGVEHTKAAYNSEADKVNFEKKNYIEVEDIHGKMVLTEANMNIYRKWMESYIGAIDGIRVIDATEGGAKIEGTEIRTLKEALNECCKREIDLKVIFSNDTYFSEEQQKKVVERIKKLPDEVDLLQEKIEKNLNLYGKLEKLNGKQKYGSGQLQKIMYEIGALNEEVDELIVSKMMRPYMAKTAYEIEGVVLNYSENDSITKQINDFVEHGRKLLQGYLDGIVELRKDIPLLLKNL